MRRRVLELGENGQRESRGLAGAGLRGAHHVAAGENDGNGAKLDGCGIDVTHRLHALHDLIEQPKILK